MHQKFPAVFVGKDIFLNFLVLAEAEAFFPQGIGSQNLRLRLIGGRKVGIVGNVQHMPGNPAVDGVIEGELAVFQSLDFSPDVPGEVFFGNLVLMVLMVVENAVKLQGLKKFILCCTGE